MIPYSRQSIDGDDISAVIEALKSDFLTGGQRVEEFEKAVDLNNHYTEAKKNAELIKNVRNGFLILLRAILK